MRSDVRLLLAIAIGGALGSVARYLVGAFIQSRSAGTFPSGILVINIVGSLLLGFIMRVSLETTLVSPETRLFLTTGFCGGFTTFSTFSYDTLVMIENGEYRGAASYAAASVVLSLIAALAGVMAAHQLVSFLRTRGAG